jgi:hypothetical protein
MDPQRYQELRMRIQSLSDQAVRMTIPDGTSQNTMKNRILRVAAELGIPVTIRRVPGGLLFGLAAALLPKPTVRLPVRKTLSDHGPFRESVHS